jgi:Domain of unknown function (DUF4292)
VGERKPTSRLYLRVEVERACALFVFHKKRGPVAPFFASFFGAKKEEQYYFKKSAFCPPMKNQSFVFSFASRIPFLLILLSLTFTACKNQKKVQTAEVMHDKPKGLTVDALRDSLALNPIDFRKISFKGDGQTDGMENGMNIGFNYKMRIRHDSLIWCSVTKFSLEFMQGIVSQDSVKMRTSMPEGAMVCDLFFLQKQLGFQPSFDLVESILTGQPWLEGDSIKVMEGMKPPYRVSLWKSGYQVLYYLQPAPMRMVRMEIIRPENNQRSVVTYDDRRMTAAGLLPHQISLSIDNNGTLSTVSLNHNTVTVNGENTNFDFRIPEGYTIKKCGQE